MGRIIYIMGKSASGKDTIYKKLSENFKDLKTYVMYTSRPMREGEIDGVSYMFTTGDGIEEYRAKGKLIESRTYNTVHGPWTYATIDDGRIELDKYDYLMTGTLESYVKVRDYYGSDKVEPVYIEVEDGLRLQRALDRERQQAEPKYKELCRRFLADSEDFSEEKLEAAGIKRRFDNTDLEHCLAEIGDVIYE